MTEIIKIVRAVQKSLSDDLLKPNQKEMLTGIHPTEGHCFIAAEAVYYMLGGKGKGWLPVVLPKNVLGNNTHWWLRHKETGKIVDPTKEQFGDDPIPYHLGKPCGFICHKKNEPCHRTKILIQRAKKELKRKSL